MKEALAACRRIQHTEEDHGEGEDFAIANGSACGPTKVLLPVPECGTQNAAAVQGKRGNEIEGCEQSIYACQVVGDTLQRLGKIRHHQQIRQAKENHRKQPAGNRPGDGHEKLRAGGPGLFRQLGHAAENEQRDPAYRKTSMAGDQRMRGLVEDNAEDQADHAGETHRPVGPGS